MKLLRILLGMVVPPLGVFLTKGISSTFFINLLLTFIGWLPGSVHAVWVMTKQAEQASAETY